MTDQQSNAARVKELNATIRYTMWSVFKVASPLPALREDLVREVDALFEQLQGKDVVVRGTYDVAGLRADADIMVWWHAESPDALQDAYGLFRRTALGDRPGLALAGAAYDGVGIPACVASGETAADDVLKYLEDQ